MSDSQLHTQKVTESEDKLSTYTEVNFQDIKHHEWRQEGNHVICGSCPSTHGGIIPAGRILGQDDDGNFVIRTRKQDEEYRRR